MEAPRMDISEGDYGCKYVDNSDLSAPCNSTTSTCSPCSTCDEGFFAEGCGGSNPGVCTSCGSTCHHAWQKIRSGTECTGNTGPLNTVICDDFLPCEPGSFRNALTGKCDTCLSSCEEEHHYIDGYCTGYDIVETDPTSCVPCTEDCGPNAYRLGCEKHSSGFCQAATECTIGLSFEIETLTSFACCCD